MLLLLLVWAAVTGCATNRGIINVTMVQATNPDGAKTVLMTKVNDQRQFELQPARADIPSLKDGQISNKAITARTIARKRNGFGKALGDILLPEGNTGENLFEEVLAQALREKRTRGSI